MDMNGTMPPMNEVRHHCLYQLTCGGNTSDRPRLEAELLMSTAQRTAPSALDVEGQCSVTR